MLQTQDLDRFGSALEPVALESLAVNSIRIALKERDFSGNLICF